MAKRDIVFKKGRFYHIYNGGADRNKKFFEDDKYLIGLCRYIHRNPFDDNLADNIENRKYSNYLEWISKRKGTLIDLQFRDKYFPEGKGYKEFVEDHFSNKQFRMK